MGYKHRKIIADKWAGLCALLLIVMLFVTGILDKECVFRDLQNNMRFEAGKTRFELAAGDAYGRKNDGPFMKLPAGEYRLKWQVEGDGDNVLHLGTTNGARVEPAQIVTKAGEWQGESVFTLKEDAHNFNIYVEFASGTWMQVHDFRLYTPVYRDDTFTAAFVIAAMYVLYMLWRRGFFTPERTRDFAVVAAAMLVVSSPFMQNVHVEHYDTVFHGARMMNLADALSGGQIPGRVGGFSYNGFGAATSVFYPDLLLYPGALLLLGGTSLAYAMNMTCMAINALSAVTMALCASRIFGRETASCAAVLYLCSPYRIMNVLLRDAVGEALAMAVLPLFILGLWEVVFGDEDRWMQLGAGACLVLMTHILSTAICAVMAMGVGVLFLPKIIREKRILSIVKAAGMAVLLSAFFLVPMMEYSAQGIGAQAIQGVCADMALEPFKLFEDLEIGIPLLISATAALMVFAEAGEKKKALMLCLFAGVCSAVMTTKVFPWSYASVLTGRLTDYLQYPARILIITMSMLSLAGGFALIHIAKERRQEMLLFVLAISLICALPELQEFGEGSGIRAGEIVTPYSVHMEYQIPGTDVSNTRNRDVIIEGDAQIAQYSKVGNKITAEVTSENGAKLTMPLFGFDGYAAELDGTKLEWTRGKNNRVTVSLPAGAKGKLCVWFEGKTNWKIADAVSFISLIGFSGYALIKKRKKIHAGC